jgi:hypothetical protein
VKKKRAVVTRNLTGKRSRATHEPKTERDMKFCAQWLIHHDHNRAFREAGFRVHTNASSLALRKMDVFRHYLERMQPKVEFQVAKKIAYERQDILAAIANIGYANALDYITEDFVMNPATKVMERHWRLKPLHALTRDQAGAIDTIFWDEGQGRVGYTLPLAKTRLSALSTLGEQAANFKVKDRVTHNHLHLGENVPLEKVRHLKQLFIEALGPVATRELLGMNEEEQAQ